MDVGRLFLLNPPMLSTKQVFGLKRYLKYSDTLIETGTALGDGIQKALDAGYKVKSIELDPKLFTHSVNRFKNNPQVQIFEGKSYDVLPQILEDKPLVFFLDAHPAGPNTAGHEQLMKEGTGSEFDQDVIIRNELKVILGHRMDHVIIIDDCQGENELTKYYKSLMPGYRFTFFNQGEHKDKILVCEP
jgi:hypothetical protein